MQNLPTLAARFVLRNLTRIAEPEAIALRQAVTAYNLKTKTWGLTRAQRRALKAGTDSPRSTE